jgi:hypothetical protein
MTVAVLVIHLNRVKEKIILWKRKNLIREETIQ